MELGICAKCDKKLLFLDEEYIISEFITLCKPCYKKVAEK